MLDGADFVGVGRPGSAAENRAAMMTRRSLAAMSANDGSALVAYHGARRPRRRCTPACRVAGHQLLGSGVQVAGLRDHAHRQLRERAERRSGETALQPGQHGLQRSGYGRFGGNIGGPLPERR